MTLLRLYQRKPPLLLDQCENRNTAKRMDTLGIEPNTSRMLSERDNQLHHVPR